LLDREFKNIHDPVIKKKEIDVCDKIIGNKKDLVDDDEAESVEPTEISIDLNTNLISGGKR